MSGTILLLAYNKKMAEELSARVATQAGVRASTFHAVGFAALRKAYWTRSRSTLEVTAQKCERLWRTFRDMQPATEQARWTLVAPTALKAVSMAKQRGFGTAIAPAISDGAAWEAMIDHFGLDEALPEEAAFDDVIWLAQKILQASNQQQEVLDFDDMIYLPLLRQLRLERYDWVLIDEAQDTNPVRRALAEKLLAPGGRLIAVGDPHQAIYGFTGADNDALDQIVERFQCVRLPLTVSYRCPQAVVRHAQHWVTHIEAHPDAPEGCVRELPAQELFATLQRGDAVLCRYTKQLVQVVFRCLREGLPAKIEGRAIGEGLIGLLRRWKVTTLTALVTRLEAYRVREVQKARRKQQELKVDQIEDQVATLLVLIERAQSQRLTTVAQLETMIEELFTDVTHPLQTRQLVLCCSVHRSKGLEWERVFLLGRTELMPSRYARQPWQLEQELNLIYVAVTRAKRELVEVYNLEALAPARTAGESAVY